MRPPVEVGELLRLQESDYCYGLGVLVIRVTEVPSQLSDPEWVDIKGAQIAWNGDRLDERQIRVRIAALRKPQTRQMP